MRVSMDRSSLTSATTEVMHLEHIIARQQSGETVLENLAWTCHRCNRHKGPNLTGIDPMTQEITPLFHPRRAACRGVLS